MHLEFDYIIIGSGFGGSVSALRLSEKGYKVLVIEKGKWYKAQDFAKTNWNLRKWLWIPALRFFGIMKLTIFRDVAIVSGTGVGGGSLVYANTLPIPKSAFYHNGSWNRLANWKDELEPYYAKALRMLGATRNPKLFDGDLALKEMAEKMGRAEQFENPYVSVFFGEEGKTVKDPYFSGEGPERAGCIYCGACMTGCRHNAKNSLDKNYLYLAQKRGAQILAETEAIKVTPIEDEDGSKGYEITCNPSTKIFGKKKKITTQGVVFSGGVLGTVKLLLKLKKTTLPLLSHKVGDDIRTNNETLISISTLNRNLDLSKGIAIGSLLHTDENSHLEIVRYGNGSGFWKLSHLPLASGSNFLIRVVRIIGKILKSPVSYFRIYWINSWSLKTAVLLFMQTVNSTLKFKLGRLGNMTSSSGMGPKPNAFIPESLELTEKYSQIINGKATSFALESIAGIPSTAHVLGGAVMGKDPASGVIDMNNRVFGYKNLLVVDGSMISSNPGVNPALTITAIAERAMDQIPDKSTKSDD